MSSLNQQRIVRKFNIYPFNYEGGRIGWFQYYYVVEEWYRRNSYWGWYRIAISTREDYRTFRKTGVVNYKYYGNRI